MKELQLLQESGLLFAILGDKFGINTPDSHERDVGNTTNGVSLMVR